MQHNEEQAEGIVLRSTEYKDRQRIIAIFTHTQGIIHVIVKGLSPKKPHLLALTSPFSQAEFTYAKGRSDLFRFVEGNLLNSHLSLRNTLIHFQAAGKLVQAIHRSQLLGKPAPLLYTLFTRALSALPFLPKPELLITLFSLKLLQHEGLFDPALSPETFSSEETSTLHALLEVRQFSLLKNFPITPSAQEKLTLYAVEKMQLEYDH